jgi:outer membrane protein assembly factor BamB
MKKLLPLLLSTSLFASDWPQFLGPNRDGSAAESEKAIVGTQEAERVWKKDLGSGFAGPVVADGKVFICHRLGDEIITEALAPSSGETIWRHAYTTDYRDTFGFDNGPRAVPAVVDGKVFTHGPEGRVEALDAADGKLVWSFDTVTEVGSPQGFFGRACSPLVADGKVLLNVGGRDGAGIIALDAKTGKLVWKATKHEAGYAAGVLVPGDASVAAFFTRNGLSLVTIASGEVLADEPFRAEMDASVNAATPLACGPGRLFFSASYDVGGGVWEWKAAEKRFTNVWNRTEALDCHYSTPVWHADHLYGFHGRQESGSKLRCISSTDGGVKWEAPDTVPGGTLIRVQDRLLIVTERGELWIAKASSEKFDLLSTTQILGLRHRSHAAYADGVLYARDSEKMTAVKVR